MGRLNGSLRFPGGVELRFATPADEAFLIDLFISSRPWLSWVDGEKDFIRALYEQQYTVMRSGQESVYPEHLDFVIETTGVAVGRLIVDLGYGDWRIAELHVAVAARGRGIGSSVIRGLQAAAGKCQLPLTLSTPIMGSNGYGIYSRLGFQVTAVTPPSLQMAWFPASHPQANPSEVAAAS